METLHLFILTVLAAGIGYWFGNLTCGRQALQTLKLDGFVATVASFALLNIVHSLGDGISLHHPLTLELRDIPSLLKVGSHEIIRQPATYFFYSLAIAPFGKPLWQKVFWAIPVITGLWLISVIVGSHILLHFGYLDDRESEVASYAFYAGDILHHLVEYLKYRNKKQAVS